MPETATRKQAPPRQPAHVSPARKASVCQHPGCRILTLYTHFVHYTDEESSDDLQSSSATLS